jgi:hypothetical protein
MSCAQVHFPTWLRFCPMALTRGEIMGALSFLALNVAVIGVRMHRSLGRGAKKLFFLYEDSVDPIPITSVQGLEVWALTFGVVAIMNVGWYLMLPIARRSVLLEIMGVSWELRWPSRMLISRNLQSTPLPAFRLAVIPVILRADVLAGMRSSGTDGLEHTPCSSSVFTPSCT